MTNLETTQKIKQAFTHAVPDVLNCILSDCETQKGSVVKMMDIPKKKLYPRRLAGIAAAFVLILGSAACFQFYQTNFTVASTVSLDVNPSIEILVNKKERVIEVNARNQDAQTVIGNMDFEGSSLDVTLNALIGSMLRNGYLNEIANSILVSVDNQDPVKSAELQTRLADEINSLLQNNSFEGAVLSQTISTDSHLQELADSYGITLGKTQLIQQLINQNTLYSFEDLVPLSINELNLLSESGNLDLNNINSLGTASDKAYIGEENAWNIALTHAEVSASDITQPKIELDYENGIMVYELDFKCQGIEYDYDIDAISGIILNQKKEWDDDALPPAGTQAPGTGTEPLPPETQIPSTDTETSNSQTPSTDTEPAEIQNPPADTEQPGYGYGWHHNRHNNSTHHPDPHHSYRRNSDSYIGDAAAKGIACTHACISEGSIYDYQCNLDDDDGTMIYELDFKCDGYEYEYDIDAVSGAILKYDREWDD